MLYKVNTYALLYSKDKGYTWCTMVADHDCL
jgi:hypothetical protein